MNKTIVKKISLYVAGFVVGGGLGYILADHFVTKAERVMDEYPEVDEGKPNQEKPPDKTGIDWTPEVKTSKDKKAKSKNKPVDYTKFSSENNKRSLEEEVKSRINNKVEEELPNLNGINIITLEMYADPVPVRDKVVLTYYKDDDTLRDEEDNIVDNRSKLIGNALEKFGAEKDGDPNTVYVRNGRTKTDYEVVRVKGSYQEIVLGEKPEEKKTKPRSRRTKKVNNLNEGDE